MSQSKDQVTVAMAPHISSGGTIIRIMWTVVAAMMPAVLYSSYVHGFKTCLAYILSVVTALASEAVMQFFRKRSIRIHDGSAVITGLLVVMSLPPHAPLWLPVSGTTFAVVIIKQLFGGIGKNLFNPALSGRAFLLVLWPSCLRTGWSYSQSGWIDATNLTWYAVIPQQGFDMLAGVSSSQTVTDGNRLVLDYGSSFSGLYDFYINKSILKSLFMGNYGGNVAEISVLMIIAGGIFLIWRKVISWQIPFCFIGALAAVSYIYYSCRGFSYPGFVTLLHLMSGSVMLGAFFMATDPVTSPLTSSGMIVFGLCCGIITFAVRVLGGFPEGIMEAILIMNAAVPLIDRITRPSVPGLSKD